MNLIRPGMGTENTSLLLEALVQMCRPKTVLEVGAGDSTLALAQALIKAAKAWKEDKNTILSCQWSERCALLDPSHIPDDYSPRLISIDDFNGQGSSAELAWQQLESSGLHAHTIEFVKKDFFTISDEEWKSWGALDFVWIDAGTPADDVRFVSQVWDKMAPGALLALHEPLILNTVDRNGQTVLEVVRTPIWEELSTRVGSDFELITLTEPHKYRQSGLGLLRKLPLQEQGFRKSSMQQELLILGVPPVRNDLLPMGLSMIQPNPAALLVGALSDFDSRGVYAAILLGAEDIQSVVERTGIHFKSAAKAIGRLIAAELIQADEGVLRILETPWLKAVSKARRDRCNFTDSKLESPELLSLIISVFTPGRSYSEAVVSKICAAFSSDYARLRRKLVDDGYFIRSGNNYIRVDGKVSD